MTIFLIMQLHTELKNIDQELNQNNQNNNEILNQQDITVDPYNKEQVFNYFYNDFALNQISVISQYFYGINQSMFECQVCKMKNMQYGITGPLYKYNYENFFYLEFPLEEVRKFVMAQKNNMMGMNMGMAYQNINQVNLDDCFNYYQQQSEMIGYCEKCGKDNAKIFQCTQIFSSPNILILIFNRGIGLQYKIKINFKENLSINTLSSQIQSYELQSVVKHLGDSTSSGHFISYCRSPIPNQNFHNCWFCYNDSTVVQTKDWSNITDIGDTYILFYQLKKN